MKKYIAILMLFLLCGAAWGYLAGSPEELTDISSLYRLEQRESYLFSSYDRSGGNDDGFNGTFSTIRKTDDGKYVVFDEKGPGVIKRIWFPTWPDLKSSFEINIDGQRVLTVPGYEAFGDGSVYPFVKELSVNKMGGVVTYVPIPFEKYCTITVSQPIFFYHFNWQKYPEGTRTAVFNDTAYREALEKTVKAWTAINENPNINAAETQSGTVIIKPHAELSCAAFEGAKRIVGIKLRIISGEDRAYRALWLKTAADGIADTINCPAGDFFLDGLNMQNSRSLLFGSQNGEYYCYAPMPFEKDWRLVLENKGRKPVKVYYEVIADSYKPSENDGIFYAVWNRQKPQLQNQPPFLFLKAEGRGKIISTSVITDNKTGLGNLEGDEMAWIDGRDSSFYNGTGTEDCFGGGWYFSGQALSLPLYGCPVLDAGSGRTQMYRLYTTDAIYFDRKITYSIERGAGNSAASDYSGVTCLYGTRDLKLLMPESAEWLPNSIGTAGVKEAEDAAGGCRIITDYGQPYTFSRSEAVSGKTINIECYSSFASGIEMVFMGDAYAVLDGKYTARIKSVIPQKFVLFDDIRLADGKHNLVIIANRGEAVLDWYKLLIDKSIVQGEKLEYQKTGEYNIEIQDMFSFGPEWSDNAHLFVKFDNAGDSITCRVPVKENNKNKDLSLYGFFTTAPDYALVKVYINGEYQKDIDCYTPSVRRMSTLLGTVNTDKDYIDITVTADSKNELSTGYYAGIDCFYLNAKATEE